MSRIGKLPIKLPSGVDASITKEAVQIKGPKGALEIKIPAGAMIAKDENGSLVVSVNNPNEGKERAIWGLTRQLVNNAVTGVQTPFSKSLEFVGVGFKVEVTGNAVKMDVGFSHPVKYELPQGVTASVEKNVLTVVGIDKQLIGEVAAQIRKIKPPEPYKGKGIKYTDEVIRRKAGKTAAK